MAQYAGWGVDFIKVDCISDHPYRPAEIRMIHRAIVQSGRPMLLSLSPGPTSPGIVREIQPYAQMWRISDDVWDTWKSPASFPHSVYDQFVLAAGWAPFANADSWPDADMLPLGYLGPVPGYGEARESHLTHDEQRAMLTLWSIARSPLILGANLTRLDDWTRQLLTNRDVLAVNQFGHDQRQVTTWNDIVVWSAEGKGDVRYLALFNLNDKEVSVDRTYNFFNLSAHRYKTRNLWTHGELGPSASVQVTLAPHACVLLELTRVGAAVHSAQ
jgi:alpha-galactosidase